MSPLLNHPPLFCKTASNHAFLQSAVLKEVNQRLAFRSLVLKKDLPIIHGWVQQDYALEYWQMNGQYSQLFAQYQCMEYNPYSQSFAGLINGALVCQIDVYSLVADELSEHVDTEPHDCGFHLLMAPKDKPIPGLTRGIVHAFLRYYFSFRQAKRLYAEPDVNNVKSIRLLELCGFQKIKQINMSYKQAYVYCMERERFLILSQSPQFKARAQDPAASAIIKMPY